MFERFTSEARDVVARSQDEARRLHHPFIGPEHLLISMAGGEGPGGQVLATHGLTADTLREWLGLLTGSDLDGTALAALGIDLVKVREATDAHLGPDALAPKRQPMPKGHLPFSKPAKKVLEHTVHEATRVQSGQLSSGHLLLGLLREADTGNRHALMPRLLQKRELDLRLLCIEVEQLIPSRAA
jgi:ATP-dependent Clp protease ATP-binding subunit ClpA